MSKSSASLLGGISEVELLCPEEKGFPQLPCALALAITLSQSVSSWIAQALLPGAGILHSL